MKKDNNNENDKFNNNYNLNFVNNNSNRYNNNENFFYQSLNNNSNNIQNYYNNQNLNAFNNTNNYFNYYNFINNNSLNNSHFNKIQINSTLPDKTTKTKNTQKRNNYIPKNLLANQFQGQNKNSFQKNINMNNISQNYYIPDPNLYYNNMLLSEHKGNFESQNSNNNNNSLIDINFKNIINDIKNNENEDSEKINIFKPFTYMFDANIEDVKEVFTDNLFFKNDCPSSIIDNVKFTKQSFLDLGNVISFRWKNFFILELETTKIFYSKTYMSYTLTLINLKPFNIGNLEMTFKYYYNTCESKTLFIIEYFLDKGILSEVFREEFLEIDMNEICKSCENILNQRKKERIHTSSVFFKVNKEYAMNFIMNFNKNKYINYDNNMNEYDLENLYKDEIEINNSENNELIDYQEKNSFKIGDSILIKKSKNKILGKLFIEDLKNEKDKTEIIIAFENLNNDKNNEGSNEKNKDNKNIEIINQRISLSFRAISKNLCFFEFKHIWHYNLSDEKVKNLNILKNASLMLFEKEFELQNNENLKNKKIKERKKSIDRLNFFNLLCPLKK